MMKRLFLLFAFCAAQAVGQDFSEGSEARSFNLYAEVPSRFEARVVDVLCDLTGDCPVDCGAGARQLGLLRSTDDVLVLPIKNSQPAFTGAVEDLIAFCGETVEVDGLMIEDEDFPIRNIYLVQRVRRGDGDWIRANSWTKKWAAAHPEAAGKGPWFRRDPRIKSIIAQEGYLGLGLEADAIYAEENF